MCCIMKNCCIFVAAFSMKKITPIFVSKPNPRKSGLDALRAGMGFLIKTKNR